MVFSADFIADILLCVNMCTDLPDQVENQGTQAQEREDSVSWDRIYRMLVNLVMQSECSGSELHDNTEVFKGISGEKPVLISWC